MKKNNREFIEWCDGLALILNNLCVDLRKDDGSNAGLVTKACMCYPEIHDIFVKVVYDRSREPISRDITECKRCLQQMVEIFSQLLADVEVINGEV